MGAQNSVPSTALPKQQSLAAIEFHGMSFLSSIYFLNMLIRFYLINLAGNVKMY